MPPEHPITDRTAVTFEQAEGLEPLPTQLKPREVTSQLRAKLWRLVYRSLEQDCKHTDPLGGRWYVSGSWRAVLEDHFVERLHRMVDDYTSEAVDNIDLVKGTIAFGTYSEIFGFLQFVLRHDSCPYDIAVSLDDVLVSCQSAYRVVGRTTIMPVSSDTEREAISGAFRDTSRHTFQGARTHLRQSSDAVSEGRYADSVRESIHSVESVARAITGRDKLSDALTELEKGANIHRAMKAGFDRLYGWTSDEQGIRHPLLDEGDVNVTEADALFMLGACASFVSLLIAKGRAAGLVPQG